MHQTNIKPITLNRLTKSVQALPLLGIFQPAEMPTISAGISFDPEPASEPG